MLLDEAQLPHLHAQAVGHASFRRFHGPWDLTKYLQCTQMGISAWRLLPADLHALIVHVHSAQCSVHADALCTVCTIMSDQAGTTLTSSL